MTNPQIYLTPKDVAERLQISDTAARREMRKMRHKAIGKNGYSLRVAEKDFEAYMNPDPPMPRPERKPRKAAAGTADGRAIPYRKAGGE
ncbi:MAG: helix-turn-helix domain-containing protein [Eubacteriales bacterium]|nr:helix-turn-helix domain-containing protein [Eubacteriales bacterium]